MSNAYAWSSKYGDSARVLTNAEETRIVERVWGLWWCAYTLIEKTPCPWQFICVWLSITVAFCRRDFSLNCWCCAKTWFERDSNWSQFLAISFLAARLLNDDVNIVLHVVMSAPLFVCSVELQRRRTFLADRSHVTGDGECTATASHEQRRLTNIRRYSFLVVVECLIFFAYLIKFYIVQSYSAVGCTVERKKFHAFLLDVGRVTNGDFFWHSVIFRC